MGIIVGRKPIVLNGLVFCTDDRDKQYYPGSGTATTDLVGGLNGTITGTISQDGTGIVMSGDRIDYPSTSNINFGTGEFTLSVWFKYTGSDFSTYPYIIDTRGSGGTFVIYPLPTNKIQIYGDQDSDSTISVNNWYNLIYTRIGNTAYIYVNGSADGSNTNTTTYGSNPIRIGARNNDGQTWTGYIPHLAFYNRGFTSADVLKTYNAQKQRFGL